MLVILTNQNGLNRIANTLPTLPRNCEPTHIDSHKENKSYEKYKLPKELGAAQVNALTPLTFFPDGKTVTDCGVSVNGQCYGFVIVDSDIMVARGVLSLFFSVIKRQQMT